MIIENTQECFVQLWRLLERTRRLLGGQYKRFCIRNVLKTWFGIEATDDFIWKVCRQITLLLDEDNPVCGNDFLLPPCLYPRKHREFLRAIVAVKTDIKYKDINLKALDKAYSIAFPKSTPINVNKKRKQLNKKFMKTPRGIRNNNPLNIRVGNNWQWERKPNTDGAFEQFQTMQYGYRAAFKLLKAYIEKHHCRTVRFIINRWAPPKENNTNAYLKRVVEISGLNPDAVIAFKEKQKMIDLAYAMTIVENGKAVEKEIIEQGYEMVSV